MNPEKLPSENKNEKKPMVKLLKYFLITIGIIAQIELLLWIHGRLSNNIPIDFSGITILTVWAAVLTIVFIVFSVIGLMNIDSRVKELNELKEDVSKTNREMKENLSDLKISAKDEREKIVSEAESQIKRIVKQSANYQTLHDLLTQILSLPDPTNRIRHYTDLLHSGMEISDLNKCLILSRRGECYEMIDRLEEATADYNEAIRLAPSHPEGYIMMGNLLAKRRHDYTGSIKMFEKALALDPNQTIMYGNIASSYGEMGDIDKAQEYLKKLRDYNVESAEYYYNKAIQIKNSNQKDPTLEIEEGYLNRCLAINPLFGPAIIRMAQLYNERKQYNEAINILSDAISKSFNPHFVNFITTRADINLRKNLPSVALVDYIWAFSLEPDNLAVISRIATCYFAIGQLSSAAQYAKLNLDKAEKQKEHRFESEMRTIIMAFETEMARARQMFEETQNDSVH